MIVNSFFIFIFSFKVLCGCLSAWGVQFIDYYFFLIVGCVGYVGVSDFFILIYFVGNNARF